MARPPSPRRTAEDVTIAAALSILTARMKRERYKADSPATVRQFLTLQHAGLTHEVFCVLHLDAQHHVLAYAEMFRGTLTQTSVYPREVVKEALANNSAAVILSHNHPSGVSEPSQADQMLTRQLKSALALVDVQMLDHIVTAGAESVSFAERGLL